MFYGFSCYSGYAAYGCGIRYRYGMFKQQIIDGFQVEVPDNWLKDGYPFELRRPEYCYEIKFGGHVDAQEIGLPVSSNGWYCRVVLPDVGRGVSPNEGR